MSDWAEEMAAKYPVRRILTTTGHPDIETCDEKVPIFDVLRDYCGLNVPGYRYKTRCPFAVEHEDPTERCFQVYESNTAWCFAHNRRWTPSLLLAHVRHWSRVRAAQFLVDKAGLNRKIGYQERYGAVSAAIEQKKEDVGDVQELAMTLQAELERDEAYQAVEYEQAVRDEWVLLLLALDRLAAAGASSEQLRSWYEVAGNRLRAVTLTAVQHTE